MKKLILSIIALTFVLVSCQNTNQKEATVTPSEEVVIEQITDLDLKDFKKNAEDLTGKQIKMSGTVDHVCKHGGQKLFIVHEESDARVKVTTGENMAAFNTELEGETVWVVGVVEELRIDEEYLREWEEEVLAGLGPDEGEKAEKVHMGEGEGEHHEHESEENPDLKQINKYREKIAESEKDYISFFSVVCVEYDVVEEKELANS